MNMAVVGGKDYNPSIRELIEADSKFLNIYEEKVAESQR